MSSNYVELVLKGKGNEGEIIKSFYRDLPEAITGYSCAELRTADNYLFDIIYRTSVDDIVDILGFSETDVNLITCANIPQFSCLETMDSIIDIVDANPGTNYSNIGYFFNKSGNETSWSKYGENHYKLTAALGLVDSSINRKVTHLGLNFRDLSDNVRENVRVKLFLRIPIVLMIMKYGRDNKLNVSNVLANYLSASTVQRRLPNVKKLVYKLLEVSSHEYEYLNNIVWK